MVNSFLTATLPSLKDTCICDYEYAENKLYDSNRNELVLQRANHAVDEETKQKESADGANQATHTASVACVFVKYSHSKVEHNCKHECLKTLVSHI
jgi:hypothetical protein